MGVTFCVQQQKQQCEEFTESFSKSKITTKKLIQYLIPASIVKNPQNDDDSTNQRLTVISKRSRRREARDKRNYSMPIHFLKTGSEPVEDKSYSEQKNELVNILLWGP